MAADSFTGRFIEYMKGVGDSASGIVKEGAYGVYDFGQVAVGGSKILVKEGANAVGATEFANNITIDDIQPVSALGKVAVKGELGSTLKNMPKQMVTNLKNAAEQGDMRAFGSAVTDTVLLADGAAGVGKGVISGAKTIGSATKTAIPKVKPALKSAGSTAKTLLNGAGEAVSAKAQALKARLTAKSANNPETANQVPASCEKVNNVESRVGKKIVRYSNLKKMESEYIGEETGAVWGSKVKYLNATERQQYQLHIKDGKLYDANGKIFDTSDSKTAFSGKGNAIFVMDENGTVFASKIQKIGKFHHSSFLSGQPIASAGEIIVENGKLLAVTRKSGHYKPTASQLDQFLTELQRNDINLSNVKIGAGF